MSVRVLHVVNHLRASGNGITNAVVDLAAAQAEAGDEVAVAAQSGELVSHVQERGIAWFPLRRGNLTHLRSMRQDVGSVVRLWRPEIIHAHTTAAFMAAYRQRSAAGRTPIVATMHNSFDPKTNVYALADQVIAISEGVAHQLHGRRWFRQSAVVTVRNGYSGSLRGVERNNAMRVGLAGHPILCVAGLYHRKGIDTLIDAFAFVAEHDSQAHLYVVGDGPKRRTLEARAAALDCRNRITFLGYVRDVRDLMAQAAVFVLPSRAEPFGLVLLEARELGVPIVATAVGGVPEVLDYGSAGLLVAPGNAIQLARAITALLDDAGLREGIRERSAMGLQDFSSERQRDATAAVYRRAIAGAV
jgi:glycosyltransferase involved in cell wall biosynthesis